MLYCFDPAHASVLGLSVRVLHFGLLILLALTIIASLKAAGIIFSNCDVDRARRDWIFTHTLFR